MSELMSDCIIDPRVPQANGYVPTRKGYAHRRAWEEAFGPIPDGMLVLHTCDVRNCVNPEHLFLGTNKENTQDMVTKGRHWNQRKTHCKWGHPFADTRDSRGRRWCRECDRIR
jgi:hypothetical protein